MENFNQYLTLCEYRIGLVISNQMNGLGKPIIRDRDLAFIGDDGKFDTLNNE